jgi:hypothetical protein
VSCQNTSADHLIIWSNTMCRAIILAVVLSISLCAVAKSSGSHPSHRSSKSHSSKKSSSSGYRRNQVASGYTLHSSVQRDSHGRIKRSAAAKDAFKRQQPCPSTGRSSGRCPGYVVDHRKPLECGGADAPGNMQWQTVVAGKAKDKTERYCR